MVESDEATKPVIEKLLLAKLETRLESEIRHGGKFKKMKKLLDDKLESATDDRAKGKIREKLYRLNNLMDEYTSRSDYFRLSYYRNFKQLKKDIQQSAQTTTAAANPTPVTPPEARSTRAMAKKVIGVNLDELAMENLLLHRKGITNEAFNVVGITGAEGVGKTTLAKSMLAKKEVVETFRPRICVSLAEDPANQDGNLQIAIATRILLALGISDETIDKIRINNAQTLPDLIHAIRLELTGKKYLIVLDDASMKDSYSERSPKDTLLKEWYRDLRSDPTPNCKLDQKLGFAFPKGSGGTVLAIGWPENVVKAMLDGDESAIHRLLPLEDPTLCWDVCKQGGGEDVIAGDEHKVRNEVVKRSNGLPVAARLMGEIVKKKNAHQQRTQPNSHAAR